MKFLGMVLRNVRRNPIRTFLTVGSLTISLFLSMILISFSSLGEEVAASTKGHNRVMVMSSQGFAAAVPMALVREVQAMPEVESAMPFSWYGGKFNEETMPFAQFGVDPTRFLGIYDELTLPPDQAKAWAEDKAGCIIGRKLAADRGLKVGAPMPLKDGVYPFNLNMTVRGIFDGPENRDLRTCYFKHRLPRRRLAQHEVGGVGQRRDDRGKGQGGRADRPALPQDRHVDAEQRLPDAEPERRSFLQHVQRDGWRLQGDHHRDRPGRGGVVALRRRQRDGDGPSRTDHRGRPSSRRSASRSRWSSA